MSRATVARRTRSTSCSNENSGVCTPTTVSPSSRYAFHHARTYGAVRSQLMHVSVHTSTTTTRPRRSVRSSGSELSHSTAPSSDGIGRRADRRLISSAHRPERRPQLAREELRLLPGGEVPAARGLVEVRDAGVHDLDPAAGRRPDL